MPSKVIRKNFVIFRPKKGFMRFEPRLKNSPEIQELLEKAGLDIMDYDTRWGRYRIRLQSSDIDNNAEILTSIIEQAFKASSE